MVYFLGKDPLTISSDTLVQIKSYIENCECLFVLWRLLIDIIILGRIQYRKWLKVPGSGTTTEYWRWFTWYKTSHRRLLWWRPWQKKKQDKTEIFIFEKSILSAAFDQCTSCLRSIYTVREIVGGDCATPHLCSLGVKNGHLATQQCWITGIRDVNNVYPTLLGCQMPLYFAPREHRCGGAGHPSCSVNWALQP